MQRFRYTLDVQIVAKDESTAVRILRMFCKRLLRDAGAKVQRIEETGDAESGRAHGPYPPEGSDYTRPMQETTSAQTSS
jgi:hypothetical protein